CTTEIPYYYGSSSYAPFDYW
nr:immunoglobulin heavy chain junction region [Macaca mulatta]MOW99197.1 immunoglobulin heavy chain junction region [Macaca mulatta]MOX01228.1 immunoglobulin heavy chain junction region [Macaca mulatta]MOX01569.1 immunoglobulin heavy chain junction region [Macaca mulatta]MOX01904.1 immunoglobulin heavy chain junction region [Macaca mulatta]